MKPIHVVMTVLSIITLGFMIVDLDIVMICLIALFLLSCFSSLTSYLYCVYEIHGMVYCGVDIDIPEDAKDVLYFDSFTKAKEYAQLLSERMSY